MSEIVSNQVENLNDDSFDDEFRLLESTLTDFKDEVKEDETKSEMPRPIPKNDISERLLLESHHCKDLGNDDSINAGQTPSTTKSNVEAENTDSETLSKENQVLTSDTTSTKSKNNDALNILVPTSPQCKLDSDNSIINIVESNQQSSSLQLSSEKQDNHVHPDIQLGSNLSSPNVPVDSLLKPVQEEIKPDLTVQVQKSTICSEIDDVNRKALPDSLNVTLKESEEIKSHQSNAKVISLEHEKLPLISLESDLDPDTQTEKQNLEGIRISEDILEQNKLCVISEGFKSKRSEKSVLINDKNTEINCFTNINEMTVIDSQDITVCCDNSVSPSEIRNGDASLGLEMDRRTTNIEVDNDLVVEDSNLENPTNVTLFEVKKVEDEIPMNLGEGSTFFCSTPIVSSQLKHNNEDSTNVSLELNDSDNILLHKSIGFDKKLNKKRKMLRLDRIEEADEDDNKDLSEKKLKLSDSNVNSQSKNFNNDSNVSSSIPCFEAPAKSILKKWHPSGFSRESFFVLDECGETDSEETLKPSHEGDHSPVLDDFEVACRSLAEELLMSSSNAETLEKYHSQLGFNHSDDKKFDEVLQELTLNCEIDEKNLFLTQQIEESEFVTAAATTENLTSISHKLCEQSSNDTGNRTSLLPSVEESKLNEDKMDAVDGNSTINSSITEKSLSTTLEDNAGVSTNQSTKSVTNEKHVPTESKDEKIAMDEEDVLLEDVNKVEPKAYVYFEYVSSDPKENEDNYNPEWQKLGKLTSDEERYKAVRDRWRSLVPPDPNRDLTCRQWKKKNNKPPLSLPPLNNNLRLFDGNEKNQLCTAVFERKIRNLLQDLQMNQKKIINERNRSFEDLANIQDDEQKIFIMRGINQYAMAMLQKRHIQECVMLKDRFDMRMEVLKKETDQKVMALTDACQEVMSFQKFYKGVGATDEEYCMYMTDMQVEELMETEEMLEHYSKFYNE